MDQKKWKQLVESIINDDKEAARAIFHDIVVEKSRDIYESMMLEAEEGDEPGNEVDALADEIEDEEAGVDGTEDETPGEEESDLESDFDAMGPMSDADEDEDELSGEDEGSLEDRVVSVEKEQTETRDKVDELIAKFEKIVAGGEAGSDLEDMGAADMEQGAGEMAAGDIAGDEEAEEEGAEDFDAGAEEEEEGEDDEEKADRELAAMMEAMTMKAVPTPKHQATAAKSPVPRGTPFTAKTGARPVAFDEGGPAKGGHSRAEQTKLKYVTPTSHIKMQRVGQAASPGVRGNGSKSPVAKRGSK